MSLRRTGVVLTAFLCSLAQADPMATLTLEDAWNLAERANPILRESLATQPAVDAELRQAQAPLYNNPQLSASLDQRRFTSLAGARGTSAIEWNIGVSQTFERPDKPRHRRAAAESAVAANQQRVEATRREVRNAVTQRFITVLALQQRMELEADTLHIVEQAEATTQSMVTAGEIPLLQGNVAAVELERERNEINTLQEALVRARADLAAGLQLPAEQLPAVVGTLAPRPNQLTLEALLAAVNESPMQQALVQDAQAAASRLAYEEAASKPDITLGLSTGRGREIDTRDTVTALTVTLPLPLFDRNETRIGKAVAEATRAGIERDVHARDAQGEVIALWQRAQSQHERVERLTNRVLPRLEQNRALAQRSYAAGQLDLLQFLLVTRQVSEGQREALEATADLARTQASLDAIAGWKSP